jgi:beta-galactosidase/beta-glucuronidase
MAMLFQKSSRTLETISTGWHFKIDVDQIGEKDCWFTPSLPIASWAAVAVPSTWNLYTEALWGYEGVGWYAVDLPATLARTGQAQKLWFGRVAWQARAWLNGQLLGEHLGGDLPFALDVTGKLSASHANRLMVRVDNAPRLEWIPGALVIERATYGGIISPVQLETLPAAWIECLHVSAEPDGDGALVHVKARVASPEGQAWPTSLSITIPDGPLSTLLPVQDDGTVTADLRLSTARCWSPEQPALYALQARLVDAEGRVVDEAFTRFGVRKIETRGQQLLLNGQPLTIRGVDHYIEYTGTGPVASREQLLGDLTLMKETGVNFIRFPCPVDPEVWDLMDEIGLLGDEEVYINWWGVHFWPGTSPAEANAETIIPEGEDWLRAMVERDFNHPSLIFWGMANESSTAETVGIEAMRRLMALGKQLDPTRLVTFIVSSDDARQHLAFEQADLVAANLYKGVFDTSPAYTIAEIEEKAKQPTIEWLKKYSEHFSEKPILITEWGEHGISGLFGDSRYSEDHQAAYIRAIWEAISSVKGISGGVLWSWADYHHRRNFIGTGLSSPFGPFGVVTIQRQPKRSHAVLKELYGG